MEVTSEIKIKGKKSPWYRPYDVWITDVLDYKEVDNTIVIKHISHIGNEIKTIIFDKNKIKTIKIKIKKVLTD